MVNSLLELIWTIEPAICWNEDDIGWSPKTAENLVYLYMYINPVNEYNAMVVNQNKLHEGFCVEQVCINADLTMLMAGVQSQVSTWLLI